MNDLPAWAEKMVREMKEPPEVDPGNVRGMELHNGVWAKPMDRHHYYQRSSRGTITGRTSMSSLMDDYMKSAFLHGTIPTGQPEHTPAPTPPDLPTRKSTEPLIGYRYWSVEYDVETGEVWLESMTADHRWETTVLRADKPPCHYNPHDRRWRDREDHGYGIYVYQSAHRCIKEGFNYGDAFGRVALSGRVVRHESGARAEIATIQEIVLSPNIRHPWYPNAVGQLTERYQCDVSYDFDRLEA